jgi:hypothetical protein
MGVWARAHHWTEELGRTGVTESCRIVVFSSEVGSIKPSPICGDQWSHAIALHH